MSFDKRTKILSANFCILNIIPNGYTVGATEIKPPTNRCIWFVAINTDGTISNAQLQIDTNGNLSIYNTVDKSISAPIVNGSCYLG